MASASQFAAGNAPASASSASGAAAHTMGAVQRYFEASLFLMLTASVLTVSFTGGQLADLTSRRCGEAWRQITD